MNEQPQKAPPSVEQSVKYMAWDIKKLVEEVKRIADVLTNQSNSRPTPF